MFRKSLVGHELPIPEDIDDDDISNDKKSEFLGSPLTAPSVNSQVLKDSGFPALVPLPKRYMQAVNDLHRNFADDERMDGGTVDAFDEDSDVIALLSAVEVEEKPEPEQNEESDVPGYENGGWSGGIPAETVPLKKPALPMVAEEIHPVLCLFLYFVFL